MKNRSGEKIKLASIDELLGVVNEESAMEIEMILSILVDTFISKISLTMQPGPKIDSISGA